VTGGAETRLAVYGTLAPGQPNHRQMDGMTGDWRPGVVRGTLYAEGRGAATGYPGIVLDPEGPEVAVQLFTSADLPRHWARLDAFEGDGYRRALVRVSTVDGERDAFLYELAPTSVPAGGTARRTAESVGSDAERRYG
jgi:gamma-glutamylcyclotransferase (GGCT)/AIG2-like uncharacterized protein YtfP